MNPPPLSLTRFRALLDAYGARLSRWPETERAAARRLLQDSAEARALHEAEQSLDASLAELAPPPLDPQLSQKLAQIPKVARRARVYRWPLGPRWVPALGFAAAAAFGLWLGSSGAVEPELAAPGASEQTANGELGGEEDALIELALGSFAEGLENAP